MSTLKLKICLFLTLTGGILQSYAQPVVPFRARYTATQKGSLIYVSNNFISCTVGTTSTGISCDSAKNIPPSAVTQKDNNSYPAAYIDIDGDPATFSSSSASISLPVCSYVTWAGLYWGGDIKQSGPYFATRDSVKIKRPGLATYIPLKADTLITHNVPSHNRMYFAYKNVTSIVQAGGIGTYTCADLRGYPDSTNKTGGWTLIVAYTNDMSNLRNLAVYDGLNIVTNSNQTNLTLSGFQTPVSGPISFECGIISFDGDRRVSGVQADSVLFNDNVGAFNPISNAFNPAYDVHNGTITYNGNNVTTRTPNSVNTMGYDADVFVPDNTLKNYLTNNQTSVTLRESTNGEIIPTQVISFAIDVFEPDLRLIKTATDLNGGVVNPGDTIQYTIQALNHGSDTAAYIQVTDTMPFNVNYVPGSLQVTFGPNGGVKTDASGDDQGEYVSAGRFIRMRLGNGANSTLGGRISNLAPNNYNTFRFRVVATTDCGILVCSNVISNQAAGTYRGYVSGSNQSTLSQPSGTDAFGCPLYGPTITTITVPPSCPYSLPADTAINDCSIPFYFSSLASVRPGYNFYNSSFAPVTIASASGTFYGIRNNYGVGCRDTMIVNFTTTAPFISTVILTHPTCTNGVNGGRIRINGINSTDSMSYVAGPTYTSAPFYRANTLSPVRTFINLTAGTYTVRVKNATGCYVDTTVTLVYDNCSPIAADDSYSFLPLIYTSSVGSNDDEPDGDPVTFSMLNPTLFGSLLFFPNGTFIFNPLSFRGTTTFSYLICDNRTPSLCDTAVVSFTVFSPLPVELTSFYGYKNRETNVLNWNTASELNNDYFEILRSTDDRNYVAVAKIKGSGTTNTPHQYSYNDNAIQAGVRYYYKLKQTDFNGIFSASKTVIIDDDEKNNTKIELFPNPNKGMFRIKINCENKGTSTVRVVSQFGSELYSEEFTCTGQSMIKEIRLSNPPKGLYYLILNGEGSSTRTKFSVQ